MSDARHGAPSLAHLQGLVKQFVAERDWAQFHTPKNLAMAIAVEAAELMDLFKWAEEPSIDDADRGAVADELADVMILCLAFANQHGINLADSIVDKVRRNGEKYPADRYRGRHRL